MQVLQEQKPACFALFWAVYLIFTGFFDKRLQAGVDARLEPFVGKASEYQNYGPEQREAGEGHPPGDAIPKEGKETQITSTVSPRQRLTNRQHQVG